MNLKSRKLVPTWCATATYVGMVVEYCGHVMECISLCGIPCLCTLLSSAFIEPSLHELDFFQEIDINANTF